MRAFACATVLAALPVCAWAAPAGGPPAFDGMPLLQALELARSRSAAVIGALATVRQREAELRIARLAPLPHLTGDYALAPQAAAVGSSTVEAHSVAIGAQITVADFLGADATIGSAAATLLASQRDADAAILTEDERVVRLYYGALSAIATLRVREEQFAGAVNDRDAAELRSNAGDAPKLDVVRADVALAQARAELARAQADRQDTVAALGAETGVDVASLHAQPSPAGLPSGGITPARASGLTPEQAAARAVGARPELASLQAQLRARQADLRGVRAATFPTVVAGAGYQRGVDTGVPVAGPAATVHLEVPIGATGGARAQIAQSQIVATSAQLDETTRAIALSAASASRDARAAATASLAAAAALDEARQELRAVELGYREGASSSLDIREARRIYVTASLDALAAEYAGAQAAAILDIEVP